MTPTSLEALFARYRDRGDLDALGRVFDRTGAPLCQLAAHLVRDPAAAEDLVQATFVTAIENARAFDAGRRLEPWLAGILVRHAAHERRRRARHLDTDRLGVPPGEEDPAHRAERTETLGRLEAAIAELPEPYDQVLRAHLLDERRPGDIAREHRLAPGTVRMQVLRGLERLRRRLGLGLQGLVPALPRGLEAVREAVLGRASALKGAATTTAVATSSIPLAAGGLLMSLKSLAAVVAVCVLAFVLWPRDEARERPAVVSAPAHEASLVAALSPPEAMGSESHTTSPPVLGASSTTPRTAIALPAVGAPSLPATGLVVHGDLLGLGAIDPREVSIVAFTQLAARGLFGGRAGRLVAQGRPDGTWSLDVADLYRDLDGDAHVQLTAVHPSGLDARASLRAGREALERSRRERVELRVDLEFVPRTTVTGRVRLGPGIDPTAQVFLGLRRENGVEWIEDTQAENDEDFAIRLPGERSGECVVLARADGALVASREARLEPGGVVDVGVIELEEGGVAIEGRIAPSLDLSLWNCALRARRVDAGEEDWIGARREGGGWSALEQSAKIHADGTFRITGLDKGLHDLWLVRDQHPDPVIETPLARVSAPASGVALGESLGRILLEVDAPDDVAEVTVAIQAEGGTHSFSLDPREDQRLVVDRARPLVLEASAPGLRPATRELPPTLGGEETVAFELGPDPSLGHVVLDWERQEGTGLPAPVVRAHGAGGIVEASGSVMEPLDLALVPGRYRLVFHDGPGDFWASPGFAVADPLEVDVPPGSTVHRRVTWRTGGQVRFVPRDLPPERVELDVPARVLDAAGNALEVGFVTRQALGGGLSFGKRFGSIPIQVPCDLEPAIPAGAYTLVLGQEGDVRRVPFVVEPGRTVEVSFPVP